MIKRRMKKVLAVVLAMSVLTACGVKQPDNSADNVSTEQNTYTSSENAATQEVDTSTSVLTNPSDDESADTGRTLTEPFTNGRPLLIKGVSYNDEIDVTPCVATYTVEPDLSNITNLEQFYILDDTAAKLAKNGFVVYGSAGHEFFEEYEQNRYASIPNFVTVDSLMHTYHLYFSYLLKNIEKEYLTENLTQLSTRMLENSMAQYELLKGSEWEGPALRNVAFFTVGAKLLDDNVIAADYVDAVVISELDKINEAAGIDISMITDDYEDYSQYKPRGYYEGDETLEKYFKAMMWYGRIHFTQENADMDRSALLITKALADNWEAYGLWESIYAVTSFFAGASDDLGAYEYASAINEAYGDNLTVESLIGNSEAFNKFHNLTANLPAPQINSIPIEDGENNVIPGFRFMGQRFTIDGAIMQKLVYSDVKENSFGEKRMLPDVLDVPAALGSDTALSILAESGATDYEGYIENMARLRTAFSQENDTLWSASLYANWLNTLLPLLTPKGEGYPMFMQSEEWTKKDLECFAGSFAELKHDTILYSKQVIAEMGDGYEEFDDRGYVEPEPLVYARFTALTELTSQGLKEYGMLSAYDEENLSRLSRISEQLLTISNKELIDEVLTDEEYDFIKYYGGYIEHFWYEAAKDLSDDEYVATQESPAATVADIATNPADGTVLEVATGNPSFILVVVKVDGKLKLARGSVYSFYQFEWPMSDRLTDSEWHYMLGIKADETGEYNYEPLPIQKPDWTTSYRDD
ncbi:MAG: DUF3160 domain-containing protein [Lachnospiraceae bacterium]|nr:DUF3160 domain-containing protein [Lachnospiraceae bacterium]